MKTLKEINGEITTVKKSEGFYHIIRVHGVLYSTFIPRFPVGKKNIFIYDETGIGNFHKGSTKIAFTRFIQKLHE